MNNLNNIFKFNDIQYSISSNFLDYPNILIGMTGVKWSWGVTPSYYRYSDGTIDTFFESKGNEWYIRIVINKNFTGSIHASSTLFGYNVGTNYFVGENPIPLNTLKTFNKGETYEMRFITHSSDGTPVVNERGDIVSFVYLKINTNDLSFNPTDILTGMCACEWTWGGQLNSYKYSDGTIDAVLEFRENEGYASFTFNKNFTGSIHASSTLFGYNVGNEYFIGDNQIPLNNITEFHSGETYEMRFTIHGSDSGSPIVNERGDMIAFVYLKSDITIPNETISKINYNGTEYNLGGGLTSIDSIKFELVATQKKKCFLVVLQEVVLVLHGNPIEMVASYYHKDVLFLDKILH